MTTIKEVALKTLDAMAEDGFHVYNITYEAGNEGFELDEPALAEYNKRLIERLAAQVPDGCVVVPREPTLEMVIAGENYVGRHAYKAMIAAGEVKP